MGNAMRRLLERFLSKPHPAGWTCKICTRRSEEYRAPLPGGGAVGMCPPCGDTPWGRAILAGVEMTIPGPPARRKKTLAPL